MSRIAGILNLDGAEADYESLSRMAAAVAGRRSDGQKIWQDGPVGLIHSHFWTAPEELGEEQPISDPDGRYWIAADARLDNRGELLHLLRGHLHTQVNSDAELILASYKLWKEDCPRYLIGDFAFALWDSYEHVLFCARDPAGVRIFNYSRNENTLFFGSNIRSVIVGQDEIPKINIPFISDLLASRYNRWTHETAYEAIFRLPQAYYLKASDKNIALKRYWMFGSERIHLNSDKDYILKFKEVFKEAVLSRTRSIGPVGLSLSGGLDSSSIYCMLNDLVSAGRVQSDVRLYSLIYNHTPTLDEKEFLEEVERVSSNLKVNRIIADDLWGLHEFGRDDGYALENPEIMSGRASALAIARKASQDGCRVLLSGLFGDEILGAPYSYSTAVLKDVDIKRLYQELPHFLSSNKPAWQLLAYGYLAPLIPAEIKAIMKSVISKEVSSSDELPNFLSTLCDPIEACGEMLSSPIMDCQTAQLICDTLGCGLTSEILISSSDRGFHTGIEYAYPFLDRRLIDLLLSVPARLLNRNGFNKYILRQAMKGSLPEVIRTRKGKAVKKLIPIDELSNREMDRIDELMDRPNAVAHGIALKSELESAYRLYKKGKYPSHVIDKFLCVESWLKGYNEVYGLKR